MAVRAAPSFLPRRRGPCSSSPTAPPLAPPRRAMAPAPPPSLPPARRAAPPWTRAGGGGQHAARRVASARRSCPTASSRARAGPPARTRAELRSPAEGAERGRGAEEGGAARRGEPAVAPRGEPMGRGRGRPSSSAPELQGGRRVRCCRRGHSELAGPPRYGPARRRRRRPGAAATRSLHRRPHGDAPPAEAVARPRPGGSGSRPLRARRPLLRSGSGRLPWKERRRGRPRATPDPASARVGGEGGRGQRVGGAPIQSPAREGEDRPRRWVRERRRGRGRSAGGRPASCLRAEREQGGRR